MKKIIAIVVSVVLGVGSLLGVGTLIYTSANRVKGVNAAKMLLARENMNNASSSFDWESIFTSENDQVVEHAKKAIRVSGQKSTNSARQMSSVTFDASSQDLGTLVLDSPAGKVYKNNGTYNFQNISGASYQGLVVGSRLGNIDFRVETAAKDINYLKNELNIVNKWVKAGNDRYYLDVTSNKETLINYYEDDKGVKSLSVVERETREDSNSVYSIMFTDMENGVLNNPSFLVYIPNERYEYYYGHDGNATDYLIAEKDKGYWNVFMPNERDYYNMVVGDSFSLQSGGVYAGGEARGLGTLGSNELNEDIIGDYSHGLILHLSALNGISGILASEEIVHEITYDGDENTYYGVGDADKLEIALNNGEKLSVGDSFTYGERTVSIFDAEFSFHPNPGFADPQYEAHIILNMGENLSLKEKLNLLETFLADKGLTCKYGLEEIEKSFIKSAEISSSITDFYEWNGFLINSTENFKKAESVIFDKMEKMFAEYQKVKDAEEVDRFSTAKLARNQAFAKISQIDIQTANYANGKIQINNLSVTTKKSNLLEENKNYKLQIGLARIDGKGNYLSQNTVHLKTENAVLGTAYSGDDLTLSLTAEFDVPTALEENRYVVVACVVTEEGQIRVSEMKTVGFVDTINDTIETSLVKISVKSADGGLLVEYSSKLSYNISLVGPITYEVLRKKMMIEVLKHGYPTEDGEITTSSGEVVAEGDVQAGEYKMKFVVSTIDGVVTAYVVCVVSL